MKIVLKQSDFSDPAILVQRNQQLKPGELSWSDPKLRIPAILVQRNQQLKLRNRRLSAAKRRPAILVQRNQQLKQNFGIGRAERLAPAILVQRNQQLKHSQSSRSMTFTLYLQS